jgi:hypothetical protein
MTSKVFRMALHIGSLSVLTMLNYGCDLDKSGADKDEQARSRFSKSSPYNLAKVKCPHDSNVTVEVRIKKTTKIDLVDPYDEYVFVCKGDKIRWVTDEDLKFRARFGAASAATNDLFGSGQPTLESMDDPNTAVGHHKQITETQVVSPNAVQYQDYFYTLLPKDTNDKTVSTNDPHVIPM